VRNVILVRTQVGRILKDIYAIQFIITISFLLNLSFFFFILIIFLLNYQSLFCIYNLLLTQNIFV
jgi:hypothetical protein